MLTVRDLDVSYERCTVLHGVSFTVEGDSVTAILGPSGAGKTTLANAVCGFVPVTAGQVVFDGVDIGRAPLRERIGLGISYVPAGRTLFAEMSVRENLQLGAAALPPRHFPRELAFILSLFPELKFWLDAPATALPSGWQRIVMFARGLMSAPRLLVLDQPSFGLAGEEIHRLFQAIALTKRELGTAVLITEQKIFQALKLSDTAYYMEKGRITGERSALELLADRSLQAGFPGGVSQSVMEAARP